MVRFSPEMGKVVFMNDDNGLPTPRKSYRVRSDDATYFIAVFSRDDDAVEDALTEFSTGDCFYDGPILASVLTGWSEFSGGPGRAFGSEPSVRVTKRAVIVWQFVALDV